MTEIIQQLLAHRSIRKFTTEVISDEQLEQMITAAQAASTSNNLQAYSVIAIRDHSLKKEISELSGNQQPILECPLFLVWCADMHRIQIALDVKFPQVEVTGSIDHLISSTVDTTLAAQNAAIAAEALGLGIVYIGGIRNHLDQVSSLLKLPKLVYPVFGLCVGVPNQDPVSRPRLPQEIILHENYYSDAHFIDRINEYNLVTKAYMKIRSDGEDIDTWTDKIAEKLSRPRRQNLKENLSNQGFTLL